MTNYALGLILIGQRVQICFVQSYDMLGQRGGVVVRSGGQKEVARECRSYLHAVRSKMRLSKKVLFIYFSPSQGRCINKNNLFPCFALSSPFLCATHTTVLLGRQRKVKVEDGRVNEEVLCRVSGMLWLRTGGNTHVENAIDIEH